MMERDRRPRRKRALLMGLIAGMGVFALPGGPASAGTTAGPWPCDGAGYVVQEDAVTTGGVLLLQRVDRQPDGTYTLTQLGSLPNTDTLNALGFRAQDGFMYAWDTDDLTVVQIGVDGAGQATFDDLGAPAGTPAGFNTVVGAFLADGTYFVWGNTGPGTAQFGLLIDVTTAPTPTILQTVTPNYDTATFGFVDFAVNPADGNLYTQANPGPQGIGVYQLQLAGNQLSIGPKVGDTIGGAGAQWFSPYGDEGLLIAYEDNTHLSSVDIATGEYNNIGDAIDVANVDGTACANGLALSKEVDPQTVRPGGRLTFTYTMTSRALVASPAEFVDELPEGMTYVPNGVTIEPPFGTPNNYGGNDTLRVTGELTPNETVTITAEVKVARGADCDVDVDNQANATLSVVGLPPATIDSDDPTTTDDIGDPTGIRVNCGDPKLALKKRASKKTAHPGEVIPYKITVRNKGKGPALNVEVCDKLPSGLTLVRAPGATRGCWTINRLDAGDSRTFSLAARVKTGAGEGSLENTATVSADNARKKKSKEKVGVEPASGSCAAKLAKRC